MHSPFSYALHAKCASPARSAFFYRAYSWWQASRRLFFDVSYTAAFLAASLHVLSNQASLISVPTPHLRVIAMACDATSATWCVAADAMEASGTHAYAWHWLRTISSDMLFADTPTRADALGQSPRHPACAPPFLFHCAQRRILSARCRPSSIPDRPVVYCTRLCATKG